MFGFFKKESHKKQTHQNTNPIYDFKWHEVGDKDNPFSKRILDVRPFTQQMTSTTKDPGIATLFLTNRASIGQEYIGFEFKEGISVDTELVYPHNGEKIEGAGYKAKEMEDKWDIYAWNDVIYFVRSWTGEVCYKAYITYNDSNFIVRKIEFGKHNVAQRDQSLAVNDVHFLILTLAFKSVQPHQIPQHLLTNEDIAAYSFSLFGRNCWYATYEDIIDLTIKESSN